MIVWPVEDSVETGSSLDRNPTPTNRREEGTMQGSQLNS